MGCPLLVANEHVLDLFLLKYLVIDRQHRTAWIAEHHFHPLIGKRSEHDLSAGHFIIRRSSHGSRPLPIHTGNKKGPRRSLSRTTLWRQPMLPRRRASLLREWKPCS